MEKEIEELEDFRDVYYENYPDHLEEDLVKAVREKSSELIDKVVDAGLVLNSAPYFYVCGRIWNINIPYESKAESNLGDALKLDPLNVDYWVEMGIALTKKPDFEFAIECLERSLTIKRTCKGLYFLSYVLRRKLNCSDKITDGQRKDLFLKSIALGVEAVTLDPSCGLAHVFLGNTYMIYYFSTSRSIEKAVDCYKRALLCDKQYRNPDLHFNYATALLFDQDFAEALDHFEKALKYDPTPSLGCKLKIERVLSYLDKIDTAVEKKGRLKTKRVQELISALNKTINKKGVSTVDQQKLCDCCDLKEGSNLAKVMVACVIATITHEDQIPLTLIAMDKSEKCFAVTVYSVNTTSFGFLIGDTIAIKDPILKVVKNIKLNSNKTIDELLLVRVNNPMQLSRNGMLVGPTHFAQTTAVVNTVN